MSTELLAIGNAAAQSADFTLTSTDAVSVFVKQSVSGLPAPGIQAEIRQKSTVTGTYVTVGQLTTKEPAQVINAPGTYAVVRLDTGAVFGVDKE